MSRRHTPRTIDTPDAPEGQEQWWDDLPTHDGIPDNWQDAWAPTTLDVCERVWSKQGAKLYFGPRNTWLRDDLHSWLIVQAQQLANQFTPDPGHPDPERQWGAYLWRALNEIARWHFQQCMGGGTGPSPQAATEAHNRGVHSLDHLEEMQQETGYTVGVHALHANDWATQDPALIIIHTDELAHDIAEAERHIRNQERSGTYRTATEVCLIVGCIKPTKGRTGLCQKHYDQERNLWATPSSEVCPIPQCERPIQRIGVCGAHATKYYDNRLPDEFMQYIQKPGPRPPKPACSEPGCDRQSLARGLCSTHYRRARLAAS